MGPERHGVRDYLVRTTERMLGWNAASITYHSIISNLNLPNYAHQQDQVRTDARLNGGIHWILQITAPSTSRTLLHYIDHPTESNIGIITALTCLASAIAFDVAITATAFHTPNWADRVDLKLAANAATHIGLDVLGTAARRSRNFRQLNTTLTV